MRRATGRTPRERGAFPQSRESRGERRRANRSRTGGLLSAELLLVVPLLMIGLLGLIEMSLLLSACNRLNLAAATGARVCSSTHGPQCRAKVEAAVRKVVGRRLADKIEIECENSRSGDICRVSVRLPRRKAAPDLLGVLGFRLRGNVEAVTAMRKE